MQLLVFHILLQIVACYQMHIQAWLNHIILSVLNTCLTYTYISQIVFARMYIFTEPYVSGEEGLLWQQAHAPLVLHLHLCWLLPRRDGLSCLYLVHDGSHSWVRCTEQLPLGLLTTDIRSIVLHVIINDGIYSIHRLVLICYNIIIMLLTIALTV